MEESITEVTEAKEVEKQWEFKFSYLFRTEFIFTQIIFTEGRPDA